MSHRQAAERWRFQTIVVSVCIGAATLAIATDWLVRTIPDVTIHGVVVGLANAIVILTLLGLSMRRVVDGHARRIVGCDEFYRE